MKANLKIKMEINELGNKRNNRENKGNQNYLRKLIIYNIDKEAKHVVGKKKKRGNISY